MEDEDTFISPTMEWRVASVSTVNIGEREFLVHSGAIVHIVSKVDLTREDLENRRSVSISDDCDHGEWVDRHTRGGHSLRERFGHDRHCPTLRRQYYL